MGWWHHTYPFILHALLLFVVIGIQGDGLPPIATLYVLADSENVAPHHHCDDEVQHSRYECEHNMICAEAFYYIFRACSVRLVALSISPMLLVPGGPGCPLPYASITVTGSNWSAQIW